MNYKDPLEHLPRVLISSEQWVLPKTAMNFLPVLCIYYGA